MSETREHHVPMAPPMEEDDTWAGSSTPVGLDVL